MLASKALIPVTLVSLTLKLASATVVVPELEEAENAFAGIINSRADLKSYEVIITASEVQPGSAGEDLFIKLHIKHDTLTGKYRADFHGSRGEGTILLHPEWLLVQKGFGIDLVGGAASKYSPNGDFTESVRAVDARIAGLGTSAEMLNFTRLESLQELYLAFHTERVLHPTKNEIAVRYEMGQSGLYRELEIDEVNGYVIKRMETGRLIGDDSGDRSNRVIETILTEWKRENDVWIPTETVASRRSGRRIIYRYDWRGINVPILDSEFDEERLDLPNGAAIFDHRLATGPIVESILKDRPGKPSIRESGNRDLLSKEKTNWLFLGNVIVVICLLSLAVYYRFLKASPER